MNRLELPCGISAGWRHVAVDRLHGGNSMATQDCVAEEVPVALEYNGVSHAVMLATPCDLDDFALGFSVTEGIVDSRSDVRDIEAAHGEHGVTLRVEIAGACFMRLRQRRRQLAGRTGYGLCGTESLPEAVRMPAPLRSGAFFSAQAVLAAMQSLRGTQILHEATGATHAAGFSDSTGRLLVTREDVGRHNALDKLIGALLARRFDIARGFVVVTSRASYEMAGKTVRSGAALLAAVSGVSGLAIDVAEQTGLALAGFARGDSLSLYAHAQRVLTTSFIPPDHSRSSPC